MSSVNAHDISISLPNNLTGYVPLTAISSTFQKKIDRFLNEEEDGEDEEDEDVLDIKSYFQLGQYLRVTVTSTQSESKRKHIELSVDPRDANAGLSAADFVTNATVQASVLSVEDHGLVMDLGLDGNQKGFMSSRELPHGIEASKVKEGSVFLCVITGKNASGSVIKLSANLQSAGSIKKLHFLSEAPTINSFAPGTAAEILVTDVTAVGLAGKIMGMLDVVCDKVQSGASAGTHNLTSKYKIGSKIKGRLVSTFATSENTKLGFSLLDHVLRFSPTVLQGSDRPDISTVIPEATVTTVDSPVGLYVSFGDKHRGFVHMSRLSDGLVDSISSDQGRFQIGSTHEARIIGFSPLDDLYILSFEKKIIDQPFLRLEDVTVGARLKVKIEKTIPGPDGIDGVIVSLVEGITGLIPKMHLSDTKLQHPEKKFRENAVLSSRVLSVDLEKRQLRLTVKKSLVNSEAPVWKSYVGISPGQQSLGTIVKLQPNGAVVQFYGCVRGFLPVSEMSEAYIRDPAQHFNTGQVLSVHALTVEEEASRLIVSCKDPSTFTDQYKNAFSEITPGRLVSGTVFEKSANDLLLKLEESGLVARLSAEHLGDNKPSKVLPALGRVRVGQKLNDLVVLTTLKSHRLISVSHKPSLRDALLNGRLPAKFDDLKEGASIVGTVRNIIPEGIFIEFLGGLTGLVPKRLVDDEHLKLPEFGYVRTQALSVYLSSVDHNLQRFALSMKPLEQPRTKESGPSLANPVDNTLQSITDLSFGKITKARIVSVKDTQLNVQLADNVQGRVDSSEVFENWESIKDKKHPLKSFRSKQVIPVRIMGLHDARNHRFLPISHRTGKNIVYELSAKPSAISSDALEPLTLERVQSGSKYVGFVNNISGNFLWVTVAPNVRGRLSVMDVADKLSLAGDIQQNFPNGSAIQVTVSGVDIDKNHLDLTAKDSARKEFNDFSKGSVVLGRVTKTTDHSVLVQLSDTVVGSIALIDMADDFTKASSADFTKNNVVRVCVIDVDASNKKISLSTRPSKVLSSSLPVSDPEITSIDQLKVGDIVRGFIRKVADHGLYVLLGHHVSAYVRISELSDSFLKEWKDNFRVDQLVKGRVISLDKESDKLQMSLKESVLDPNYKVPVTMKDLHKGQIVTGKVRSVEDFGAFIVIDGTANVSGLCHRTEMAETPVEDARKFYEKDDIVKAKILKIDSEKGRMSLGLKASYFEAEDTESEDDDGTDGEEKNGMEDEEPSDSDDDGDDSEEGVDLQDLMDRGSDDDSEGGVELPIGKNEESESDVEMAEAEPSKPTTGLVTGGFDWTGNSTVNTQPDDSSDSDSDGEKKKKPRKPEIKVDRTGDLDINGPQTGADYERLLLGEPNSSLLWLRYMAYQLEAGEIDRAREIAERALRTIAIGEDAEKLEVWIALLNLENTFGTDESLDNIFKRACQYHDSQEIHRHLISIFVQSGKNDVCPHLSPFITALPC